MAVIYIMNPDPTSIHFDREEEAAYLFETLLLISKIIGSHKLEECTVNLNERRF